MRSTFVRDSKEPRWSGARLAWLGPRTREPFRGAYHAGAAPGVLGRVAVVGAGEHAGELRRGDPPRGQPDDQEHQVLGVEVTVEDAVALGGRVGPRLVLVVGGAARLVGHRASGQPLPEQLAPAD